MPTNRNRRQRKGGAGLDDYRRVALVRDGENGCLLAGQGYGDRFRDGCNHWTEAQWAEVRAEMRADWSVHRDELMTWWLSEEFVKFSPKPWIWVMQGGPGTRPWAWWAFDAPEPRRDGETEAQYLVRLNLLLPGEAERLAAHGATGAADR